MSNLVMREWESHFTREYGWPLYVEYHHALLPHDGKLDNSDRLRAAKAFTHPLLTHVAPPQQGDQPTAKSFAAVTPAGVQLSALRRKPNNRLEVRVVEVEGRQAQGRRDARFPRRRRMRDESPRHEDGRRRPGEQPASTQPSIPGRFGRSRSTRRRFAVGV